MSSFLTDPPRVLTLRVGELIDLLSSLTQTQLIVLTTSLALQLCDRSVITSDGRVVADGRTPELLANVDLLAEHRLELPLGFDPSRLWRHGTVHLNVCATIPTEGRRRHCHRGE